MTCLQYLSHTDEQRLWLVPKRWLLLAHIIGATDRNPRNQGVFPDAMNQSNTGVILRRGQAMAEHDQREALANVAFQVSNVADRD